MKKLALLVLIAMSLIMVSCGSDDDDDPVSTRPYSVTVSGGTYTAVAWFSNSTTRYTWVSGNTITDTKLSTTLIRVSGTGTGDNPFIGTWEYSDGDTITFYDNDTFTASWW